MDRITLIAAVVSTAICATGVLPTLLLSGRLRDSDALLMREGPRHRSPVRNVPSAPAPTVSVQPKGKGNPVPAERPKSTRLSDPKIKPAAPPLIPPVADQSSRGKPRIVREEAAGLVSSRRIVLSVTDFNNMLDDWYAVEVNGQFVGEAKNDPGERTDIIVNLEPGENVIVLRLLKENGLGTLLTLTLEPGGFSHVFVGSVDHIYRIVAP